MTKKIFTNILFTLTVLSVANFASANGRAWNVQSIDTMKTSRDQTLYKMNDQSYDKYIQTEVDLVKKTGANYITVDGAYDSEYVPWMKKWVKMARKAGLNIWFRGNFSAWHGWFGPKAMSRQDHLAKTRQFILNNPTLFEDGDIFTACPECEYGGPGNPLETNDVEGFRQFMIEEEGVMREAFRMINKDVNVHYTSMNPDVAKEVVDAKVLSALGNTITLDYFFNDIAVLRNGLDYFRQKFPGIKFVIGEFGAPIPEINGVMSDSEKAHFIESVFHYLYEQNDVVGVNYWVSTGGATELYDKKLRSNRAEKIVASYYKPKMIQGTIRNEFNQPIVGAKVAVVNGGRTAMTNEKGEYELPIIDDRGTLVVTADDYQSAVIKNINLDSNNTIRHVTLYFLNSPGIYEQILRYFGIWK